MESETETEGLQGLRRVGVKRVQVFGCSLNPRSPREWGVRPRE